MAGGATEREADEPQLAAEEEEAGMNPLDPRFSEYDPKQRKYIYTRYFYRPKLDLDQECMYVPTPH